MMRQRMLLLFPALLALLMILELLHPTAAQAQTTTTLAVSGRQLLVNGQPYIVRGVNYKPTPYTGPANWGDDWTLNATLNAADMTKMQEMGANTIRVYVTYERLFNNWDNHDPTNDTVVAAELTRYQTALAQAQAHGISVIMNYWLPYGVDYTQATPRSWHKLRFRKIINTFKNLATYPNILMWAFGNENNLNRGPLSNAQLFAYYGEAIAEAKSLADTTHPYTVVLGDDLSINNSTLTNSVPVDIWSLNVYQTSQGFSNIINSYSLTKPLLFSEFGTDAYNMNTRNEDQASQASFYTDRWSNYIGPNLSANNANNKLLGGAAFSWNDEWWKAAGANDAHDSGGWSGNIPPDYFLNEEWFGLSMALPDGSSGPRSYRQAFGALKALWATQPGVTPTPTNALIATATRTPTATATSVSGVLSRSGWVATGSSTGAGETPANALDGNATTRWSTGAAQVNGQWFQVDMLSAKTFNQITLDSGTSTGDYPRGYQVFVSNDGANWGSAVATGTGATQLITIPFTAQTARYIRVVQTGSTGSWWSLHEFNVYGSAATSCTGATLSRSGWDASASSTGAGETPGNAIDGNATTRWSTGAAQVNGQWFQLDMLSARTFCKLTIDAGTSTGDYPRGYQVFVSNDGVNWGSAVASGSGTTQLVTANFAAQTARYVRIIQTGSIGNWWSLHELNVIN